MCCFAQHKFVVVVFSLLAVMVYSQEHPEWVKIDDEKCGGCEREHSCYKPKQFDYPRMCVPNNFDITLSFKKSLPQYCKNVINEFWDNRIQPATTRPPMRQRF